MEIAERNGVVGEEQRHLPLPIGVVFVVVEAETSGEEAIISSGDGEDDVVDSALTATEIKEGRRVEEASPPPTNERERRERRRWEPREAF